MGEKGLMVSGPWQEVKLNKGCQQLERLQVVLNMIEKLELAAIERQFV